MNELFWPSQTSEASGGSLVGTMSADRASGPQMPATYEQVLPVQSQEPQATPDVAGLSRVQAQGLAQDGQQAPPFKSITMKADGTFKMEGDQSMLAEVMGQLTDLKQMKMAAMARVAQLKQQEASGSPLIDALSTFAGNMAANDPKMPGWIRALGQTSLQMGPQGIRAKREAEENRVLKLGQTQAEIAQSLMANERADRQVALGERAFAAGQEEKALARVEKATTDILGRYKDEVDKGRAVDPMLIAAELVQAGQRPERAIAAARQMASQAEINAAEIEGAKAAEIRSKQDFERFKVGLDMNKQLTVDARRHALRMAELQYSRNSEIDKLAAAASAKEKGERKLPAKARETLIQINALDDKLDSLAARAAKYSMASGPIGGPLGSVAEFLPVVNTSEWASERRAIRSELQRFVAQYVKAVQGGGNTISNKDVENAAKALPNLNMTPQQFVALVRSIKEEGQYQRDAFRAAYEADWDGKDSILLGAAGRARGADLPGDFVDFLKSLPSGKGGKFTDGKTYVLRDGVPVEVR